MYIFPISMEKIFIYNFEQCYITLEVIEQYLLCIYSYYYLFLAIYLKIFYWSRLLFSKFVTAVFDIYMYHIKIDFVGLGYEHSNSPQVLFFIFSLTDSIRFNKCVSFQCTEYRDKILLRVHYSRYSVFTVHWIHTSKLQRTY